MQLFGISLSAREVWSSILGWSSRIQCRQRLATAAVFLRSCVAQLLSRGDGFRHSLHAPRSLVKVSACSCFRVFFYFFDTSVKNISYLMRPWVNQFTKKLLAFSTSINTKIPKISNYCFYRYIWAASSFDCDVIFDHMRKKRWSFVRKRCTNDIPVHEF